MNVFFIVIILALAADYLLDMIANWLNLRRLGAPIPPGLEGIYKPEDYQKSQDYTRVGTRFGFVTGTFSLAVLLAFWFAGGFNWLDLMVRGLGLASPIVNGLIYIGILALGYALLTLPFSVYHTFVIENRFGFNRTTPRIFILDLLKGWLLGAVLGGALLASVLALLQYAGSWAWLYAWAAVTAYALVVQYVAPTWIMPLFNKFTPVQAGELRDAIMGYARSVDFPLKNVFLMDASRRSTRTNAFFTGFGRNKRIVLYDTLVKQQSTPEIVAVLAHEIGHHKMKHILRGTLMSILHTGLIFFLLSVFLRSPGLYEAFFVSQPSIYTGLVFFGLLYSPLEMVISIFTQWLSRRYETEADRFAARTAPGYVSLGDALKKLSADNLSNLTPHPFYVFLNYSHPPLRERLKTIEGARPAAAAKQGKPA